MFLPMYICSYALVMKVGSFACLICARFWLPSHQSSASKSGSASVHAWSLDSYPQTVNQYFSPDLSVLAVAFLISCNSFLSLPYFRCLVALSVHSRDYDRRCWWCHYQEIRCCRMWMGLERNVRSLVPKPLDNIFNVIAGCNWPDDPFIRGFGMAGSVIAW